MDAFFTLFTQDEASESQEETSWYKMLTYMNNISVACLCVTIAVPIGSGAGAPFCAPVVLVTMAGVLFKLR